MYAKTLITLALAGSALATPTKVLERDLPTITNALASVNSAATALDTAVKSFSGAGDVAGLQSAGAALLSAITDANSKIAATSQLTLTEAIGLQSAAGGLTDGASTLVTDLINKKPAFDAVCASGAVLDQLNKQKEISATLSQTIVSKIPDALQSIAQSQSGGVTDAINKGIAAYQGSPSSCSSQSSAAAGTSAAATTAAPATSSAAAGGSGSGAASSAAPAASSAPASSASSAAGSSSAAPSKSASVTASASATKATPTPSSSGTSIVPFTGAAAPQSIATGLLGFLTAAAAALVAL